MSNSPYLIWFLPESPNLFNNAHPTPPPPPHTLCSTPHIPNPNYAPIHWPFCSKFIQTGMFFLQVLRWPPYLDIPLLQPYLETPRHDFMLFFQILTTTWNPIYSFHFFLLPLTPLPHQYLFRQGPFLLPYSILSVNRTWNMVGTQLSVD